MKTDAQQYCDDVDCRLLIKENGSYRAPTLEERVEAAYLAGRTDTLKIIRATDKICRNAAAHEINN